MKFRIRKRKRDTTHRPAERPPQVIEINACDNTLDGEDNHETRWALQKVFADRLVKISQKHLNDSRQVIRRRNSLADASTAGDSSESRPNKDQTALGAVKPKSHSFRITCGVNESSVQRSKVVVFEEEESYPNGIQNVEKRNIAPCMLTAESPLLIQCSDRQAGNSKQSPKHSPSCRALGSWCPLSIFPDSYNHDFNGLEHHDFDAPHNFGSLFLLTNALRRKVDTKRNGIPKVITIATQSRPKRQESSCCGGFSGCNGDFSSKRDTIYSPVSFDSSILRLEQELMRANLEADVEHKYETPMHHNPGAADPNQERTGVTAISVTSSISTRSSLKFGASIVKLPSAMEPPASAVVEPAE